MAGSFPTNLNSAWSLGGSLLTFLFPMCLFIVVASILYVQCTRPHKVPGHHDLAPAQGPPEGQGAGQPSADPDEAGD